MAIQNRTVTIKGIFAEDATTTIPQTPVSEQSYRDTGLSVSEVKAGWPFKVVVDSAKFNEYLYELSTISRLFEIYGFLPWSASTNYEAGSCCLGTDGKIYQAKQNTGPSSTAKDPVTDSNHTYWNAGFARLPDNNTWTGTNAFGTITVPNRSAGDSTSNAANTAFVTAAINAVNNNALHKTGDETASGIKKFSSSPLVPTPATSDNSDKSANTEYVQANLAGAVSSIKTSNLTANRTLVSDGNGKIAVSATTSTELGYLHGVTSAIQTQINSKQATITGAATTIASSNLTASRAIVSSSNGKVAVSSVTATELGYLSGTTSKIQTQINNAVASIATSITNMLKTLYPVNSIYIGVQSTCPLATLISGSTWTKIATKVVINVDSAVAVKGTGKTLGLTNGSVNVGLSNPSTDINANGRLFDTASYNVNVSNSASIAVSQNGKWGVVTDATRSGLTGEAAVTTISVNIWKRTA